MRLFVTLLLALLIPFNAAFAATNGICDALEGKAQHGSHPGHHSHEHGDDASDELAATGDVSEPTAHSEDHHHSHAHALFAVMLSTPPGLDAPPVAAAPPRPLARDFISVLPARLERPPRATPRA